MPGRYFEECEIGARIAHAVARTITDADNILITTLTHNTQPLHFDAEYARGTEFGQILVNSCFTFSLMVGVSVSDTTEGTLVANLGFNDVVFPKPVFIGDTLRTESEIIARRESKSRPDAGLVTFRHVSTNQRGEIVAQCTRTVLMRCRPA